MTWKRTNSLQAAILASFTALTDDRVAERFEGFHQRDWNALGSWLHASGLALYFLQELRTRRLYCLLPPRVLEDLQQNQVDNCERTESLIREFIHLNQAFRNENLNYFNVKGFSLGEEYCENPALRSQFDLDFGLARNQAERCEEVMHRLGYETVSRSNSTLEFCTGGRHYPKLRDFYKPRHERVVEIHLRSEEEMAELPTADERLHGFEFPTLSREQTFLQHALHLTKHLRHEWTRASWMLELRNSMSARSKDAPFWNELQRQCASMKAAISVGIAVLATAAVFPLEVPTELSEWSLHVVPGNAVRWIARYAQQVVTSQFPGSKLYLLLDRELFADGEDYRRHRRSVLLPARIPGSMKTQTITKLRLKSIPSHVRYIRSRSMFHVREGLRLLLAESKWRKSGACKNETQAAQGSSAGTVLGRVEQ